MRCLFRAMGRAAAKSGIRTRKDNAPFTAHHKFNSNEHGWPEFAPPRNSPAERIP